MVLTAERAVNHALGSGYCQPHWRTRPPIQTLFLSSSYAGLTIPAYTELGCLIEIERARDEPNVQDMRNTDPVAAHHGGLRTILLHRLRPRRTVYL